jgi:hypothetical protein
VLPSVSTLRRTVSAIDVKPGFNDNILEALKHKVQAMSPNAALCTVVFDEMSIKETLSYNPQTDDVDGLEDFGTCGKTCFVANHATVFLVRGLTADWKQPVGYFLSSGPI